MFHVEQHQIDLYTVSRETFSNADRLLKKHRSSLEDYLEQLLWWNKRINLVSRDVSRETLWHHLRHSLLLPFFPPYQRTKWIVDAGTGGGLPGIPLAIASPDKRFILNDIVTKKVMALRQIVKELELNHVQSREGSIEDLHLESSHLLVSKHAFQVDELYGLVKEKPWETVVLYKGLDFKEELEGIDDPLRIECHDLSSGGPFFDGKALVMISRRASSQ